MPDDNQFDTLEERLRDEARGLMAGPPAAPLVASMRNTFVQRRRRRRIVQTLGAAAAVLIGLAGVRWLSTRGGAGGVDGNERETPRVANVGAEGRTLRAEPSNRPRDPVVIRVARDSQALRPGLLAIGVLIARPRPDGETELVPGLFVPEQAEPIDSRDWSPAERLAVSRLLGPEANLSKNKTI